MADNKVQVDLVAENRDLVAKLADAEARLAAVGQKGGSQAASGLESVSRSANALSAVLRLVTIPAVAVGSALRFAQGLNEMLDTAKHLRNEFNGIAETFARGINNQSIKLNFGDAAASDADLVKQANAAAAAISKKLEEDLSNPARIARARGGKVGAWLGEMFGDLSDDKLKSQAQTAINGVYNTLSEARKNAAERDRRETEELQQQDLQARIAAAVGNEKIVLEAELSARKETEAKRRAGLGRDADLRRKLAEDVAKADRKKAADAAEAVVQGRDAAIRDQQSELATTEAEKEEIAHQGRLAAIRKEFRDASTIEDRDAMNERFDNELEITTRNLKKIAQEIRQQRAEMLREIQRAQTSGFGLNGGGPPSLAGTGTALQFLTDNIASFARTQGGGR